MSTTPLSVQTTPTSQAWSPVPAGRTRPGLWLISAGLLVGMTLGSGCGTHLTRIIHSKNYKEIVPPSTLVPPGTIVKIIRRSPLVLERVCSQRAALGEVKVEDSSSANEELVRALNTSIKLGGDYLQQLRLRTQIDAIENVSVNLNNVHILELSRDVIREGLANRSAACTQEIEEALRARERLAMVQSVIQADVSYTVDFKRGFTLEAGAEGPLLRGLGVALDAMISHGGSTKIMGSSLYWGIRELTNAKSGGLLQQITNRIKANMLECRDPEDPNHRQALQ